MCLARSRGPSKFLVDQCSRDQHEGQKASKVRSVMTWIVYLLFKQLGSVFPALQESLIRSFRFSTNQNQLSLAVLGKAGQECVVSKCWYARC